METFSVSTKRTERLERMQFCPARPYIELKIPDVSRSVDKLTVITVSHDQGFSNEQDALGGTYQQSYTWFEVLAISPANHERSPARIIQFNVHASDQPKRHVNVWDRHGSDVDVSTWLSTIRGGDTVHLIPRAEFPAWVNHIYEAEMKAEGQAESDEISQPFSAVSTASTEDLEPSYYHKLQSVHRQIRILEIEPGQFDDPIACGLNTLILDDDHIEYSALSYCWGSFNRMEKVLLRVPDDKDHTNTVEYTLDVTSTLHDALKHLRPVSGDPLRLWVDYVCINQRDLDERANQVAIMPYIYSRATQVHIWLGVSSKESTYCFQYVQRIAQRYATTSFDANRAEDEIDRLHEPGKFHDNIGFIDKWRKCDFAWFKRTWVLQEVANAKSAVVHCGRDTLPWPVVLRLSECIMAAKRLTSLFRYSIMPPVFSQLFEMTGKGHTSSRRSVGREILDVLVGAHDLEATDQRDKIFALLQFGTDTHDVENLPPQIIPDYRKSTVEVFADFTRCTHSPGSRVAANVFRGADRPEDFGPSKLVFLVWWHSQLVKSNSGIEGRQPTPRVWGNDC
ncbi:Heterokaryon incompatibility protein 6, OR allele [Cytospora mali]|uniref:Heterokaryon incompatibility protein 6, OR allele n=1 Tax=Cytospora mali TaxID=578113 RepID=A0A194UXP1_CYTMA|nr:Heterokaryon incompatibility protein 6, OR allele [Valsa mali var. pyri (nom. inval.)]